jgi:hypothetical protein
MRGLKTKLRRATKKRAARKRRRTQTKRPSRAGAAAAERARDAAAKVGAPLTFRAEVMPGLGRDERTFAVARVLRNGRVELKGLTGQHALAEFEPVH